MKGVILRTCPPAAPKSCLLGACVQMMWNVALVLTVREESGFNLHSAGTTCRSRASKGQTALLGISLPAPCSFSKEEVKWERTFLGSFLSPSLFFAWEGSLVTLVDSSGGRGPRSSTFQNQCQFTLSNSINRTISATNQWIYTQQQNRKKDKKRLHGPQHFLQLPCLQHLHQARVNRPWK